MLILVVPFNLKKKGEADVGDKDTNDILVIDASTDADYLELIN